VAEENPEVILTDHFQRHYLRLGDLMKRQMKGLDELHCGLQNWMNFFTFGAKVTEDKMSQLVNNNPAVMTAYEEFQRFPKCGTWSGVGGGFSQINVSTWELPKKREEMKERFEIARNLKKKGLDITLIAETTGLTPKEIEGLD